MKYSLLLPVALALAAITACTEESVEADGTEISDANLAELIGSADETSVLASALEDTGLTSVFEGPGGYTMLAPSNEALDPIASGRPDGGNSALFVAVLRDHIMPGQLDLAAINQAIDARGGKVSIATVGTGTLTFSREGKDLRVRHNGSGRSARLTGREQQGSNGGFLMIDQLLVLPPTE